MPDGKALRPRKRPPSGMCPAEGGDPSGGIRSCGFRLANTVQNSFCSFSAAPMSPEILSFPVM